ncbi:hypothetical protein C0J52_28391 [Blattella germanica]|nr:hypothetical protein C0J52_28391 [Blattella germanica]
MPLGIHEHARRHVDSHVVASVRPVVSSGLDVLTVAGVVGNLTSRFKCPFCYSRVLLHFIVVQLHEGKSWSCCHVTSWATKN